MLTEPIIFLQIHPQEHQNAYKTNGFSTIPPSGSWAIPSTSHSFPYTRPHTLARGLQQLPNLPLTRSLAILASNASAAKR